MKNKDRADLQEAVRLCVGCGCPMCVKVVSGLAELGLPWSDIDPPCKAAKS